MSGRKISIPVKFFPNERLLVFLLAEKKNVSAGDIVRRSVRLLLREIDRRGPTWDWIEETAKEIDQVFVEKMITRLESRAVTERIIDESAAQRRAARGSSKSRRAS